MLPQTLPIRFLLNHRRDTAPPNGADKTTQPGWAAPANGTEPTPLWKLDGLGAELGLDTLWFKEWKRDTSQRPSELIQVYTTLAREVLEELEDGPFPTHLFLQAGTGDLAAAVAGHFWHTLSESRPRIIVVEPANADCVLESILASRPTPDSGDMETNMSALACREVSPIAWPVLKEGADAFLSISDYAAEATVELLEEGVAGDPSILAEPSGAAGLAGLIAASFEPALTGPLELGPGSRVLVLGWEGPA